MGGGGTWTLRPPLPGLLTPWYPPSSVQGKFTASELPRLPYRYASFSFGAGDALALTRLRPKRERTRDGHEMFANFEVTGCLRDRLRDGAAFVRRGETGWAWDRGRMDELRRTERHPGRDARRVRGRGRRRRAAAPEQPRRVMFPSFIYASPGRRRAPDSRGRDGSSESSPDSFQLP